MNNDNNYEIKTEGKLPGYNDKIRSKSITFFMYSNPKFKLGCELDAVGNLHIYAMGGNILDRDGTGFSLNYISKKKDILKNLLEIIKKQKVSHNNGYILEVEGISNNLGDTISVKFKSDEKIYKSSNKFHTISEEAIQLIYDAFHQNAIDNGFDFTTEKSNVKLYDDATEQFLQGRWIGQYLGKNYIVDFVGNSIKIYCDGLLTDDNHYFIIRGSVRQEKKKPNVQIPSSEYDFEEFNGISSFKKKNETTLLGYFSNDNATIDLIRQ